jgi:putative transposase
MPEHIHFLVSEPSEKPLAGALKAIKLSVALRRRERPFWSARYYEFNVFTEKKRIEKLRYIHRNPVTRRLVSRPEDWPWSSFLHYATGAEGTVEIESPWTTGHGIAPLETPTSENPDVGTHFVGVKLDVRHPS